MTLDELIRFAEMQERLAGPMLEELLGYVAKFRAEHRWSVEEIKQAMRAAGLRCSYLHERCNSNRCQFHAIIGSLPGFLLPAEPTQSEPGRHKRNDGSECPYLASETCNKCGWVDCQPRAPDTQSEPGPEGHCCVRQKCTADALDSCCCPECAARRTPRAPSPAPEPRREFSELRNYDALAHGEISREEFARRELARAEPRKEPERELDFKTFCTGEPPPHDWDVSAPTAAFCRRCGMYRPYAVRTWTREQIEAALYEAQTDTAGDSTALDESAFWRALEGT